MPTSSSEIPPARRLGGALEPLAGGAQFAPECHANYAALGFAPSPGKVGLTEVPDRSAYFTSRGSVMGQVPGEVVAAAFAVFNPAEVIGDVSRGWALTDAATIWAARQAGATGQLRRILGADPPGAAHFAELLLAAAEPLPLVGRPLFAGHRALDRPDEPLARLWLAADALREFRGDSHTIVWTAAGFDPIEIGLLSDLYWGLPPRAHTSGRGWSAEQLAAGEERLRRRGFLDGEQLSAAGAEVREAIEAQTDAALAPAIEVLGDDLHEMVGTLDRWGDAVRAAGGYLTPAVRFTCA
jgi:Helix-turn-helix family